MDGAAPPTIVFGEPVEKCLTLMASNNSHSDRSKPSWVHQPDGRVRPLRISEKERLVGLEIEDTIVEGLTETTRHRL
eukprot:scaffold376_cov454-Pavlova_lutheri.AAC.12